MQGLIQSMVFLVFTLFLGLLTPAPAKTSFFSKLATSAHPSLPSIQPANRSLVKGQTQYVNFGIRIPSRPVNRKYSLAFTLEPAKKDLVLRKGKVVVSTKTRAEVRIILDIPGRIEDKKGELIPISFAKKGRAAGGMSTFQTIGRGDVPVKAKLIIKDLSSNILDAMQLEALGEGKEDTEGSNKGETSVEKQSGIRKSCFSTEPALLEFAVSTGGFCRSVITILNEQDQPLHIKGYLQYIAVKSSLSSFSLQESKGYFPDLVVIEPSEFDLQPGEKRKVNVICQVPQGEEERYYARVVLELDFPDEILEGGNISPQRPDRQSRLSLRSSKSGLLPSFFGTLLDSKSKEFLKFLCLEKTAGVDINRGATEKFSAVSQKFKETSSNLDKPLEFMITFRRPQKVKLNPNGKIAAKDYRATAEEITLEGQIELVFPEGIGDLKAAYDKRLPPGKYLAEVSFKHEDRMLISQSHTFRVE